MAITLNGTTGITTPDITSTAGFDSADLTGDIAAARITDALNATGSAPIYAARAWVNFNGTGTVAIRESGNVSSITDNGTGNYTVNFTTAMPDGNYSVTVSQPPHNYTAGSRTTLIHVDALTTFSAGSVIVESGTIANGSSFGTLIDFPVICVAIFR